jgi:fimbrial chaperone protein
MKPFSDRLSGGRVGNGGNWQAQAAATILLWPIDPVACGRRQRHGAVDPEPGNSATTMQVRIVRWKQEDGHERYTAQQDVVASPPIVTIGTGSKQLIRLIKQASVPAGRTGLPHYRR